MTDKFRFGHVLNVVLTKLNPIVMNRALQILLFSIILLNFTPNVFAEKFRVADEYVTVYAEEERITKLGRVYSGEVYEAEGTEGTMYVFKFKGRKAYVATYCCKIEEDDEAVASAVERVSQSHTATSEQPSQRSVSERTSESGVSAEVSMKNDEVTPSNETTEHKQNNISDTHIPDWMSGIIGLIVLLGLAAGLWSLFSPMSFSNFFNSLAGRNITWCSKATYFRPLILVFGAAIISILTQNTIITLVVAEVYEIILLSVRAKKLGGLRPAISEALYLVFYGIGSLLLCWIHLLKFILAAGASSGGSSGSNGKDVNRCCGRCAYYCNDIPSDRCLFHSGRTVHPSDSCETFTP